MRWSPQWLYFLFLCRGLTNRFVLSWVQEQTGFYESGVVVEWLIDLESQLFHVMRYTVETGFQFDL